MITVKELKELLEDEDDARVVILAKDAEGNGYAPLFSSWSGVYADGEMWLEKLTDEDIENGYSEDDLNPDGKPALILTP